MSHLCVLEINTLSVTSFANIFSHSVGCLFILFLVSFAAQKLMNLLRSHLFSFIFISLGGGSKKILLQFLSECSSYFSFMSFIAISLRFRTLIHFEFMFCVVLEMVLISLLQFPQHNLLNRLSFFHCILLPPLS